MQLFARIIAALITYSFVQSDPSDVDYYELSPPVYPSPPGTGNSPGWQTAYTKARSFVSNLSLSEKLNLTHGFNVNGGPCVGNTGGIPRLGFRPLCLQDGPAGVRNTDFVSSFPAGIHVAATWDKDLMYRHGKAVGEEFHGKGVNIALGPCSGPLGRIARGGRNWEGFGPDPYLAGIAFGQVVRGVQDAGVIATAKHYLLNEQEWRRVPGPEGQAISSNTDDRTVHELYAWPFMDALYAGAASVMCSYQRSNHSYGCQNSKLLNGILKTEFGFEGFVVTDWGAQHSGVASALAGLDMVMPDAGYWGSNLTQAVNNGSVPLARIDDMATRTMAAYYFVGQDEQYPEVGLFPYTQQHPIVNVQGDHAEVIRDVGAAGHVLVKNVNNTLPLKHPKFVSVFGYDAETKEFWGLPGFYGSGYDVSFGQTTFNGTLIIGGGSGSNAPSYIASPFKAIQDRVIKDKGMLRWDFWHENPIVDVNSDVCLVFINAYATESLDRPSLVDTFSDNLVKNVAVNCPNTVVVVHSAGIRVVDEWIENKNVTAVIFAGVPGQETGNALVDVLYGTVSPSGKLPYTVAKKEQDYGHLLNSTLGFGKFPNADFSEGVYIDYRAFDKNGVQPRFEFGFGLTYTEFVYSDIKVERTTAGTTISSYPPQVPIVQGGNPALWEDLYKVTCKITNVGSFSAADVPQLYVGIPNSPVRQLRGFDRVPLNSGQTRTVEFMLKRRDLSIWDVGAQQWKIQNGDYSIWVGASSRDLKLNTTLKM